MNRIRPIDAFEIIALSILWGSSYLFMRSAAPEFGPAPVVFLRLLIASVILLPILIWRVGLADARRNVRPLLALGVISTAIPYLLLAFAALSIPAGMSAILNSTMPLFGALIGYIWLGERIGRIRVFGLLLGIVGVTVLVWGKLNFRSGGSGPAIVAVLTSALIWASAGPYTRHRLGTAHPLTTSVGTIVIGMLVVAPFALYQMPDQMPSLRSWLELLSLGAASTALGTLIYFRLLTRARTVAAMSVMFLNPVTAMIAGSLYLGEMITLQMFAGCAIVLLGTALSVGLIGERKLGISGAKP